MVELKLKFWSIPRGSVCLMMLTVPQLEMFTGTGAMKSLTSEPNDAEARLLIMALPNALHVPDGNTPAAVRLMAASPNSFAARLTGADGSRTLSFTVVELTEPSATLPPSTCWFPQQGRLLLATHWLVAPVVVHVARDRTGVPEPLKSKVIRRSPAVRFRVTGPLVVEVNPGVVFWLISKLMLAEPGVLARSQAR